MGCIYCSLVFAAGSGTAPDDAGPPLPAAADPAVPRAEPPRLMLAAQAPASRPADAAKDTPAADAPAPESKAADPEAEAQARHAIALRQLQQARNLLAQQSSVRARMVETISIFDHTIKADGRYLQGNLNLKSNDRLIRMELKMKVADTVGSLLEVCDGQVLWTRHDIGKDVTITRRNVTQILDAAAKHGGIPAHQLIADLGLGGIPALLASFERVMRFNGIRQETIRNREVDVIQGTWTDTMLSKWQFPRQPDQPAAPLPIYIPDLARIYLDRETGFPHRVLYLKRIPNRDTLRPMLTLDFLDVVLNQPIDKSEFDYVPPSSPAAIELTPQYLSQFATPAAPPATGASPAR